MSSNATPPPRKPPATSTARSGCGSEPGCSASIGSARSASVRHSRAVRSRRTLRSRGLRGARRDVRRGRLRRTRRLTRPTSPMLETVGRGSSPRPRGGEHRDDPLADAADLGAGRNRGRGRSLVVDQRRARAARRRNAWRRPVRLAVVVVLDCAEPARRRTPISFERYGHPTSRVGGTCAPVRSNPGPR